MVSISLFRNVFIGTTLVVMTDAFAPCVISHQHDKTLLFGKSSNNNNCLSKQEQEDLISANALFFDNDSAGVKHITCNTWPRSSWGRKLKKRAARKFLLKVEIRTLPSSHPLAGQFGLFAAVPFRQYDIVGEYTGEVFEEDEDGGGGYETYLENRDEKYALGVSALKEGSECRFINHFQGIAKSPNVVMKIAYVDEFPRVMIVCTKDLDVGEEFLLQYSDEYVRAYINRSARSSTTEDPQQSSTM